MDINSDYNGSNISNWLHVWTSDAPPFNAVNMSQCLETFKTRINNAGYFVQALHDENNINWENN